MSKHGATAAESLGLAYTITSRFLPGRSNLADTQEFSDACLGLVKAERGYNSSYKFSTFAMSCMKKEMINGIKYKNTQKRSRANEYDGEIDFNLVVDWNPETHTSLELRDICDRLLSMLDDRSKSMLHDYYFEGLLLSEVAKKNKISGERVRQIIEKALLKIKRNHAGFLDRLKKDLNW